MGNPLVIKFYKNGFSLIEIVIGIALFLIIALGVYGAFRLSVKVVHQSKARITAIMLANERIEEVRNLPYNDIGTVGGIPSGDIPQTENVVKNGVVFTVKTTISYVDDPFDGTAPDDFVPNDYKRVKVKVFWSGLFVEFCQCLQGICQCSSFLTNFTICKTIGGYKLLRRSQRQKRKGARRVFLKIY